MAALQCEICGGKLVGKPGGIFECDSCGMEYSTEWAKAKIQEIKGTVKVEGTVEVTGKVQVEGGSVTVEGAATKESLLKRAKMCCAEKQWKKAGELLEQVLNADPECGEAYLYSYMSKNQMRTQDELHSAYVNVKWKVNESRDIEKALCFAAGETAEMLAQWEQDRQAAIEEDRKHRQKMRGVLEARRKLIEPAKKRIVMGEGYIAGLRIDGTVALTGEREGRFNVGSWCDIVAIAGDYDHMSKVSSGSVTKSSDCRICDLKAEFNRQINASSAVIFIVGDMTGSRTAGSGCERVSKAQSQCYCTPYKQNTNGSKACKVSSTSTPDENGDFGNINACSYLHHEFEQAKKKKKTIIIVYNSTRKEANWLPSYMSGYEDDAKPFWKYDASGKKVGDYAYIKEALGF